MSGWHHVYLHYDPEDEGLREALCTLGNGYFATRAAAEESSADSVHYPGTYLAGGYNRAQTELEGRIIENEDLVNFPNWLPLTFSIDGDDWFSVDEVELLGFRQELDMKRGLLTRELHFRDSSGRETKLHSRRLVHMGNKHLAAIEWALTPVNWSGRITVRSALDGTVVNSGVARYRKLEGRHLTKLAAGESGDDGIWLTVQTRQSRIEVAQAARTRVFVGGARVKPDRRKAFDDGFASDELSLDVRESSTVVIEKVVALYSSRDRAISEAGHEARQALERAPDFAALLPSHEMAWQHLWRRCDIKLRAHERAQRILRLHVFHLLQTVSMHSIDFDVGVPARGLHGEAYRGHIFWDELFIFPYLNFRVPELTRALLRYRYRRLGEARHRAREAGFRGALYPWQSGSSGREETQQMHLNPKSGRWLPDNTHLQYHVNSAIAYNVWQYYKITHDFEFLSFYGAEMILEIARFWASIATFNPARERYEIRNVMGPDEFHDAYPDSDEHGVHNNSYTNVMAAWVLQCALRVLDLIGAERRAELCEALGLDRQEIDRWTDISKKMLVLFHDGDIISQFECYGSLEELDWQAYRSRYGDIHRLDRILEAEGDTPNRYKASKQADALMLFYLFSAEELTEILGGLGYDFSTESIAKNIDYYLRRSSHGSTLSRVVHSWVLARSDRPHAWQLFTEALESDISDVQGGTTREGIHLGAMAGTIDLVQRCFMGLTVREQVLWFDPQLPDEIPEVELRVRYLGRWLDVDVKGRKLTITARGNGHQSVEVGVRDELCRLGPGETREFAL